jgi:hypothetical protein
VHHIVPEELVHIDPVGDAVRIDLEELHIDLEVLHLLDMLGIGSIEEVDSGKEVLLVAGVVLVDPVGSSPLLLLRLQLPFLMLSPCVICNLLLI